MATGKDAARPTRRKAMMMGGAALATAVMPIHVRADFAVTSAGFANPPAAVPVASGTPLALAYLVALGIETGNPKPTLPSTLYALNAQMRSDISLSDGTDTVTLTATAYVDPANTSQIVPPVVGPTIELTRGTTTGVWLQNSMKVCGPVDDLPMTDPDASWKPHGFTTTNLHTHGLHVDPNAPSDDVLLMIRSVFDSSPDVSQDPIAFAYSYAVPADHPVGTYWYHPHKHGSVASQVGPGMAGALIVRGTPGDQDFDDLLATRCNIGVEDEAIVVLQTIPYFYTAAASNGRRPAVYYPLGYYIGGAPNTCDNLALTAGPSPTPTTVNGVLNPQITATVGQIKRLRIINATNGQTYVPKFRAADGTAPVPQVYAIAVDGIALLPPNTGGNDAAPYFPIDYSTKSTDATAYWTTAELITLAPGQRLDLLVQASAAGSFELYGATGGVPTVVEAGKLNGATLLTYTVQAGPPPKQQTLPTLGLFRAATINRPDVPVVNTAGPALPAASRTLVFKTQEDAFDKNGNPTSPAFLINDQHFDGLPDAAPQLTLTLEATDVWDLSSTNDAHIFHIHINSFQAFARVPYLAASKSYGTPVFYAMPIWRDTVYFDAPLTPQLSPGTRVFAASRQVDYTGEFVLHCHNLFHEDNGMMFTVAIQAPGASGPVRRRHKH